jgi:hypothetical protein
MIDKLSKEATVKALEDMAALGLIEDTGERRNGQIVYRRTKLFLRMAKMLPADFDAGEQ